MLNRVALIVRYRAPFIAWVNDIDEEGMELNLEDANEDNQVYLLDPEDADALEEWLDLNHELLFENELEAWCEDEALWPDSLDRDTFDQWFAVEAHSVIYDVGSGPVFDDEDEGDDDEDFDLEADDDDEYEDD
jgi:hypothetical protein